MQLQHKKVWALALWVCMTLPPWAGAEERPGADAGQPAQVEQTAPAAEKPEQQAAQPAEKPPEQTAAKDESFQHVELDLFIEQEQHAAEQGKKLIKMARPVSFDAKMKRLPEQRQMEYIYTALELSGVSPMPEVHHRMFIETGGGRIIPVYVEKNAVTKLNVGLKEEEKARFLGYHVYSYAKGPAILVVDFAATP